MSQGCLAMAWQETSDSCFASFVLRAKDNLRSHKPCKALAHTCNETLVARPCKLAARRTRHPRQATQQGTARSSQAVHKKGLRNRSEEALRCKTATRTGSLCRRAALPLFGKFCFGVCQASSRLGRELGKGGCLLPLAGQGRQFLPASPSSDQRGAANRRPSQHLDTTQQRLMPSSNQPRRSPSKEQHATHVLARETCSKLKTTKFAQSTYPARRLRSLLRADAATGFAAVGSGDMRFFNVWTAALQPSARSKLTCGHAAN